MIAALTRQQLCAALAVSESTVRRWELDGLPCTPIGARGKRYHLVECQQWLRGRRAVQTGQERLRAATDCTGTAPVALRAASASHASGTMAGTAVSPPSHALTVRRDTPSSWAAFCWV